MIAYDKGKEAFAFGKTLTENPYKKELPNRYRWSFGWKDAKAEADKLKQSS